MLVYSLLSSILNQILHIPVFVFNIALLIKLECLILHHLWLSLIELELAWSLVLVPNIINGWIERWFQGGLELDVTLGSGNFFLWLLWNWYISHARYINHWSDLSIWDIRAMSSFVFKLSLLLSWGQTLEWRNLLVLISRSFYFGQIEVHLQWSKGPFFRCLVVKWSSSCFRSSKRHG